jgi:uncharacterized protein YcbK (DUF882 family)
MVERSASTMSRRRFLRVAGLAGASLALAPVRSLAASEPRSLSLTNLHTGESLVEAPYFDGVAYEPEALAALDRLLRDHRSGETHPIDPALYDLVHAARTRADHRGPVHVISGYRSPKTNEWLRQQGRGTARRSMHMSGRAIDLRMPGTDTAILRDAALALRRGGVGYYVKSDFVHLDVGRVRHW